MAAVTLQDLISRALQRADMVSNAGTSNFATTAELTYLANAAVARLHDKLVTAYDDQFVLIKNFSLVNGQEQYDLSSDLNLIDGSGNPTFYKIREIFLTTGSGTTLARYRLRRFNTSELPVLNNALAQPILLNIPTTMYRLVGTKLFFEPVPSGAGGYNVELWYVPQVVKLVNLTDAVDYQTVFGWDEYVVNEIAINLKLKEETDTGPLQARQQEFERQLDIAIQDRNIGATSRVTDVYVGSGFGGVFGSEWYF